MAAAPDRLLVEATPLAVRVALMAGSRLLELHIDRPGGIAADDVFAGRVVRIAPAIGAAFVDLGPAGTGLLRAGDACGAGPLCGRLHEGQRLAVAIGTAARDDKGPLLTQRFDDPQAALHAAAQAGPPRPLRRGPPVLERLAARYPEARIVAEGAGLAAAPRAVDADVALRTVALLKRRCDADGTARHRGRRPLFEEAGVDEQLARALAAEVALASGARLRFETGRTLTAIDLDRAAASGRAGSDAAINLEAVPVLARQLRLRNLAGLTVVDFLNAAPRDGRRLMARLAAALKDDPAETSLDGPSRFGLVQIARQRLGPPLAEAVGPPARAAAEALARQLAREARAGPATAFEVRASPQVTAALLGADGGATIARWLGRGVAALAEDGRRHDDFAIAPAGRVGATRHPSG